MAVSGVATFFDVPTAKKDKKMGFVAERLFTFLMAHMFLKF
jgi:hypothetical protein